MKSRLRLSKPARRARSYVSNASRTVCPRLSRRTVASSNDCTPRLKRLTPRDRNTLNLSRLTVPGFASNVISALESTEIKSLQARRISSMCAAGTSDGVPPPKYTDLACAFTPNLGAAPRISRATASAYGPITRAILAYALKSQYVHFILQKG